MIDTACWVHATSQANLSSINAEGLVRLNKCQDSSYDGVLSHNLVREITAWKWAAVDVDVDDAIINFFYIPPNQEPILRGVFMEDVHIMLVGRMPQSPAQKMVNEHWTSHLNLSTCLSIFNYISMATYIIMGNYRGIIACIHRSHISCSCLHPSPHTVRRWCIAVLSLDLSYESCISIYLVYLHTYHFL